MLYTKLGVKMKRKISDDKAIMKKFIMKLKKTLKKYSVRSEDFAQAIGIKYQTLLTWYSDNCPSWIGVVNKMFNFLYEVDNSFLPMSLFRDDYDYSIEANFKAKKEELENSINDLKLKIHKLEIYYNDLLMHNDIYAKKIIMNQNFIYNLKKIIQLSRLEDSEIKQNKKEEVALNIYEHLEKALIENKGSKTP